MAELVCPLWVGRRLHFLPDAITLSKDTVIYFRNHDDPCLRIHEDFHRLQFRSLGWFRFVLEYVWETLRRGYRQNRFEIAARQAQDACMEGARWDNE